MKADAGLDHAMTKPLCLRVVSESYFLNYSGLYKLNNVYSKKYLPDKIRDRYHIKINDFCFIHALSMLIISEYWKVYFTAKFSE